MPWLEIPPDPGVHHVYSLPGKWKQTNACLLGAIPIPIHSVSAYCTAAQANAEEGVPTPPLLIRDKVLPPP